MKNKVVLVLLSFFVGLAIYHIIVSSVTIPVDRIECQVDEPVEGGKRADIPVGLGQTDDGINFNGSTVSVTYHAGDEYEPQSYFSMTIFESEGSFVQSVMYDFRPERQTGPINVLSFEGEGGPIRLQCWVES